MTFINIDDSIWISFFIFNNYFMLLFCSFNESSIGQYTILNLKGMGIFFEVYAILKAGEEARRERCAWKPRWSQTGHSFIDCTQGTLLQHRSRHWVTHLWMDGNPSPAYLLEVIRNGKSVIPFVLKHLYGSFAIWEWSQQHPMNWACHCRALPSRPLHGAPTWGRHACSHSLPPTSMDLAQCLKPP